MIIIKFFRKRHENQGLLSAKTDKNCLLTSRRGSRNTNILGGIYTQENVRNIYLLIIQNLPFIILKKKNCITTKMILF